MIGYYTKFTTKPEDREKLAALLVQAAQAMDSAAGCRLYEVSLDAADPAVIAVNELWTDEAAHDESLQLDSAKVIIAQAMPLMTDKPKQSKLGPVITSWLAD